MCSISSDSLEEYYSMSDDSLEGTERNNFGDRKREIEVLTSNNSDDCVGDKEIEIKFTNSSKETCIVPPLKIEPKEVNETKSVEKIENAQKNIANKAVSSKISLHAVPAKCELSKNLDGLNKRKSYLGIYKARQPKTEITDTSRSTYGDNTVRTISNDLSDPEIVNSPSETGDWETASMYMKLIKDLKKDASIKEENIPAEAVTSEISLISTNRSSKLSSMSELAFSGKSKSLKNYKPFAVPHYGGLGADIDVEKLNRWKRKQEYGKKVNIDNRIKIIQRQFYTTKNADTNLSENDT